MTSWWTFSRFITALASFAWLTLGGGFVLGAIISLIRIRCGFGDAMKPVALLLATGVPMLVSGILAQVWLYRRKTAISATRGFEVKPKQN